MTIVATATYINAMTPSSLNKRFTPHHFNNLNSFLLTIVLIFKPQISKPKNASNMRFPAISALFLAAAAVDAAAVEKRACVEYVGNSWGCQAPAGQPQDWNYCQVANPNYPVR